jgi:hypothetical protein
LGLLCIFQLLSAAEVTNPECVLRSREGLRTSHAVHGVPTSPQSWPLSHRGIASLFGNVYGIPYFAVKGVWKIELQLQSDDCQEIVLATRRR